MFGVFANVIAVAVGSIIGLLLNKGISEKMSKAVMYSVSLATLIIGIQGSLVGKESLVMIISLVVGTIIGTLIDIDKYINNLGEFLKKTFTKNSNASNMKFVEGFVTASVLYEVGAMCILGSIEAGINKNYDIFFVKSTLDFITSIMLSTTLGIGVMFSAISVFVCQGIMTMFASSLKWLAENQSMMNEITCVGNVLIIGLSLNMLKITNIKIANMVPAIFIVPLIYNIAKLI